MVDYSVVGNIAVLAINNPPVNAIGFAVRHGLSEGIEKANSDSNVKAILLYGKGRTFPAGADITEFAGRRTEGRGLTDKKDPGLVDDLCEGSNKPIVAAVHGTCLGGGFELALLAHYRIANNKAVFGFPEVKLGILPGWGGTQRLPRAASLKVALEVIPSGGNLSAKKALEAGIVEKVVSGDILEEGLSFTRSIIGKPFKHRVVSQREVPDKAKVDELVQGALFKAKKRSKGELAPIFNIKAVEAAVRAKTFAEGLAMERQYSALLFPSGQAVALQYAFFAERAAAKWELPGGYNNKTVKARPLRKGCVVGAGTMGTGIAMAMLNAGIQVVLIEQDQKFLDKGVAQLKEFYSGSIKLGRLTPGEVMRRMSMLKPTVDFKLANDVDIVVEAVYENMALKKQVFSKLDSICKPGALLCTNTSALNIDEIASATKRPQDVIGTHFFVPAYYMRLLENVRGAKTSPESVATATEFGLKIGKLPVLVGNCFGFVGNRMYFCYGLEAVLCVEDGALPSEVDQALEDFGMPLGPFKTQDLSGLDIGWHNRKAIHGDRLNGNVTEIEGIRYSSLGDILCMQGRLGRKTGSGWYRYAAPGAKVPFVDDDVTDLIIGHCRKNGIERRRVSPQEIQDRCLYSMINEGFKILEEGIASKPEDIDTIWFSGYGFPRHAGGPMFYGHTMGLPKLYEKIRYYQQQHPTTPHWKPSALLTRLADQNVPISGWGQQAKSKL